MGTGYSYCDSDAAFTTDVDEIASDLVTLFTAFLEKLPVFEVTESHIHYYAIQLECRSGECPVFESHQRQLIFTSLGPRLSLSRSEIVPPSAFLAGRSKVMHAEEGGPGNEATFLHPPETCVALL